MDVSKKEWISHKDYLDSCNLEDLINLAGFVEERINKIKGQDKYTIYAVEGPAIVEGYFENYENAKELLIKLAKEYDELDCNDTIRIRRMKVYESELSEFIDYPGRN